jgi:Ca2+/Na+ antiporter
MSKLLLYIIEFSIGLSAIYLLYRLLIHKEANHQLNRFTLIAIPVIALTVTLIKIDLPSYVSAYYAQIISVQDEPDETITKSAARAPQEYIIPDNGRNTPIAENKTNRQIPFFSLIFSFIGIILFIRLLIQNLKIVWMIKKGTAYQSGKLRLIKVVGEISPFSYFRYVFLNSALIHSSDLKNILAHEHVHYIQKHSWDNLYLELIGLFQWFNPFYWLLRASLKETHEYLADEGALNFGIDRTDYQVLLLNQVAEGPLLALACNFSKSLTKKRIIMMQKSKKSLQRTITKLFFLLPVIVILALIFSCNTQTREKQKTVAAISPTKMNVLYVGVDNPMAIAVSGVSPEEITVETDNGEIEGELGNYVVKVRKPGTTMIKVYRMKKGKKELLQESEFRVKTVPDPEAYVAGRKGGEITREELLKANEVQAFMENFDFDLTFRVLEFVISTTVPGTFTIREEISKSNTFSKPQIDLIKSLVKNQKIYFENIVIVGPDGIKRKLGTIGFEITG